MDLHTVSALTEKHCVLFPKEGADTKLKEISDDDLLSRGPPAPSLMCVSFLKWPPFPGLKLSSRASAATWESAEWLIRAVSIVQGQPENVLVAPSFPLTSGKDLRCDAQEGGKWRRWRRRRIMLSCHIIHPLKRPSLHWCVCERNNRENSRGYHELRESSQRM